jgi:hypothetical protein
MASEAARVAAEDDWQEYRRKPGLITYTVAGILYLLPKIGPLRDVAIKGPTAKTEEDYVRSVNRSSDALRAALAKFGGPKPGIENRDLDTGAVVTPGSYKLTDKTYAELLLRLVIDPRKPIPADVKSDILHYYADPAAPILTKNNPEEWSRVQKDLKTLETMPVIEPERPVEASLANPAARELPKIPNAFASNLRPKH